MTSLDEAFAPLAPEEVSQPSRCRNQTTWRAILPIPADAPQPSSEFVNNCAPAGYSATDQWWYRDAEGRPLGLVVRYDRSANGLPAHKQFKPFTFCEGPDGRREWRCQGFAEPRPLYGLDNLAARPDAAVLVIE